MTTPADARPDWTAWRRSRDAEFADPYGWLSVTTLDSLDGTPRPVDGLAGLWWAEADGFHHEPSVDAEPLLVDGLAAASGGLVWDRSGPAPRLQQGRRRVELLVRSLGLAGVRVRDPEAPGLRAFGGVPAFDYDPAWRVPARYTSYVAGEEVQVGSAAAGVRHTQVVTGEVAFTVLGVQQVLRVNDGSWIAFRDVSTGQQTNPHCRWVEVDTAGAHGVIDFNFSANPPCAFTDFGTCPLPPAGNDLDVAVLAGERDPRRDG